MEIQDLDLKSYIENCTGQKFDRYNKMKSPFNSLDKNPSFYIFFDDNAGKWKFKDFSTDYSGDIIDFDMNYNNTDYVQARANVGLPIEKSESELEIEKIEEYINWSIGNQSYRKGDKLLGIFRFADKDNNTAYFKAKFRKVNGDKELTYFSVKNGKVENKRNYDYEIPFNLYNAIQGVNEGKQLIFVEGERDVVRLNHELSSKKYVAVSIKNCKEKGIEFLKNEFMKVLVIPDNDAPGLKYLEAVKNNFIKCSSMFKIVNLPSIKAMGKGADVTDWLESGHTKQQLLNAFDRSLDLKDKFEFQQDSKGIYKFKMSKDEDEPKTIRIHVTDFTILEASKIEKVDAESGGIRLKMKSCIDGKIVEKVGSSKIFDDLKSFRNFLGMDFSFMGANVGELVKLKGWVNKFFAIDNAEIYNGAKFIPVEGNEGFQLITSKGSISPIGVNYTKVAENTKIDILDIEPITKEELQNLMQHIFKFVDYSKAISIVGSAISFLEVGQNIEIGEKLHHLLIVGESGSGKSTILEKVVAPLLNYPVEEKKAMSTSPFAIQKMLSTGNYPILFDEFKPSMMDKYKSMKLSDIFRTSYDRLTISRGDKTFNVSEFKLDRPLVIAGEESYPNQEKANITRSCIVYISKHERTKENEDNMYWLIDHEELLKKLGKTLILEALNLPVDEYKNLRTDLREIFKLNDRPLNTAVNISCGIELLNKVLIKHGLEPIGEYYRHIEQNIREEVLDGGEDSRSAIEQMLCLYNDMLQDNSIYCNENAIKSDYGKIYFRTQLIIDAIHRYIKDYQSADIIPLKIKDFKKQAKKSGYIIKSNAKQFRVSVDNRKSANANFDEYDRISLQKLKLNAIVECGDEDLELIVSNVEDNVIQNLFARA